MLLSRRQLVQASAAAGYSLLAPRAWAREQGPAAPPFVENVDDRQCLQCCVTMILRAHGFAVDRQTVARLTHFDHRYYTWQIIGASVLSRYIADVKMYSELDYARLASEGQSYLKEFWSPKWYRNQVLNNDPGFHIAQQAAKDFIVNGHAHFHPEKHSIDMILSLVDNNYVIPLVPYAKLYGTKSTSAHSILMYGADDDNIWFHDPGRPPRPAQRLPFTTITSALNIDGDYIVVPKKANRITT